MTDASPNQEQLRRVLRFQSRVLHCLIAQGVSYCLSGKWDFCVCTQPEPLSCQEL